MNLPQLSPVGEEILATATRESTGQGHHYLGVEHLFLALAEKRRAELGAAFAVQKTDLASYLDMLRQRTRRAEAGTPGEELAPTPRSSPSFSRVQSPSG